MQVRRMMMIVSSVISVVTPLTWNWTSAFFAAKGAAAQ
jgi:hypothetical protein